MLFYHPLFQHDLSNNRVRGIKLSSVLRDTAVAVLTGLKWGLQAYVKLCLSDLIGSRIRFLSSVWNF